MFGAHFRSPDGNDLLSPDNGINPAILQQCFQVFTGLTRVALKIGFHPPSRPFLVSTSPTRKMTRWSPFCHSLKPIQQLLFHVGCIFSPFGLWPLWLHLWNVAQLSPLLRCAPWLLPPHPRPLSCTSTLSTQNLLSHSTQQEKWQLLVYLSIPFRPVRSLRERSGSLSTKPQCLPQCQVHPHLPLLECIATGMLPHCIFLFPCQRRWLTQDDMFHGPRASVQQCGRFSHLLCICLRGCALKEVALSITEN